jgi:serine/threonine protein phosphatase PrpC
MEDFLFFHRKGETFFLGVCDGHSGPDIARWLKTNTPKLLETLKNPHDASELKQAALSLDEEMRKQGMKGGSTLLICILTHLNHELEVTFVNTGDSRAMSLDFEKKEIKQITRDHIPCLIGERNRIEAAGGDVVYGSGTHRVAGMLAVSRAMGDFRFKTAATPYQHQVIAYPEIYQRRFLLTQGGILLGSDGVFESLRDDQIYNQIVKSKGKVREPAHIMRELCLESIDKKSLDNHSGWLILWDNQHCIVWMESFRDQEFESPSPTIEAARELFLTEVPVDLSRVQPIELSVSPKVIKDGDAFLSAKGQGSECSFLHKCHS